MVLQVFFIGGEIMREPAAVLFDYGDRRRRRRLRGWMYVSASQAGTALMGSGGTMAGFIGFDGLCLGGRRREEPGWVRETYLDGFVSRAWLGI